MSNELIAMLLQFLILCVFATAIRSVNKGQPGKGVALICGLFCIIFSAVIAGLNFPVLVELAPFVRSAASTMWSFTVDGFVSFSKVIKELM